MDNAHNVILAHANNFYHVTHNLTPSDKPGGGTEAIGFNFAKLHVANTELIFCEDPQMSDSEKYPNTLSDGTLRMGMTYYFIDATPDNESGKRNIEILARGRKGVNRRMVYFEETGMTGEGKATSSVDAKRVEMLKQSMLVVYRTNTCGILSPGATA